MIKLFKNVKRQRELLIDESQLQKALVVLTTINRRGEHIAPRIINCGWALAPNCYVAFVNVTDKVYDEICRKFNKYGVELLDEATTGY